jgi:hypothetical protein
MVKQIVPVVRTVGDVVLRTDHWHGIIDDALERGAPSFDDCEPILLALGKLLAQYALRVGAHREEVQMLARAAYDAEIG